MLSATPNPSNFAFFPKAPVRTIVATKPIQKPRFTHPSTIALISNQAPSQAPANPPPLHTWSVPVPKPTLPVNPPPSSYQTPITPNARPQNAAPKRKRGVTTDSNAPPRKRKNQSATSSIPSHIPNPASKPAKNRTSTPSSTTACDDDTSDEEIDFTFSRAKHTPLLSASPADTAPALSIGPFGVRENVTILLPPNACANPFDGSVPGAITSESVVKQLIPKYKTYFRNLDDPSDTTFDVHPTNYPVVTLEYPNVGASERSILLAPIDEDHYNPITELIQAIHTIVAYYILPEEQAPFGTLPFNIALPPHVEYNHYMSFQPQPPDAVDHLRNLTKSYHTRNGPLFVQTVNTISWLIRERKVKMLQHVKYGWRGIPPCVWQTLVEECYQRCVGPSVKDLAKYAPFSNTVYGELTGPFLSDIIHRTGLGPGSTFVDLGCGVGNCLIQASLQAGCTSNGIEINAPPAALAKLQVAEYQKRLRLWGVQAGPVNVREGDFCDHEDVRAWMKTADVVLVNNWAFSATLNASLSLLFLDLKEGAQIISLKPFRRSDFRLTDRTAGSPEAIFRDVEEIAFRKGTVSWTNEGGIYYLHTVDRGPLREFTEHQLLNPPNARRRRGAGDANGRSPALSY